MIDSFSIFCLVWHSSIFFFQRTRAKERQGCFGGSSWGTIAWSGVSAAQGMTCLFRINTGSHRMKSKTWRREGLTWGNSWEHGTHIQLYNQISLFDFYSFLGYKKTFSWPSSSSFTALFWFFCLLFVCQKNSYTSCSSTLHNNLFEQWAEAYGREWRIMSMYGKNAPFWSIIYLLNKLIRFFYFTINE